MKRVPRQCQAADVVLSAIAAVLVVLGWLSTQPCAAQILPPVLGGPAHTPVFAPGRIIVGLDSTATETDADRIFGMIGAQRLRSHPTLRMHILSVPPGTEMSTVAKLRGIPHVRYAEPDYIRHLHDVPVPNDALFAQQWNLAIIQAQSGWNVFPNCLSCEGAAATGPLVAMVDSGIDLSNPDLAGTATGAPDNIGHGTAVAGIIVATANNNIGVAGLGYNLRLASYQACFWHELIPLFGTYYGCADSDVINSIEAAVNIGARVINLSLGDKEVSTALCDAVQAAVGVGSFIVASSGNDGQFGIDFPAACVGSIAVAASDSNDQIGSFSHGSQGGNFLVTAPGVNVWTTMSTNSALLTSSPTGFGQFTGTSAAAPHVTALVALMVGLKPSIQLNQIEFILAKNSDKVGGAYGLIPDPFCPAPSYGCTWNNSFGYGRINVSRALCAESGNIPQVQRISPTSGPVTGGTPVTITGACLSGTTAVNFGAALADPASLTVNSPSQITITSPPASNEGGEIGGLVDITVTASGETSTKTRADLFAYGPVVTAIAPSSGPMQGGTTVAIYGEGFSPLFHNTEVRFGALAAENVTCNSSELCIASTPAAAPGTVDVTVSVNGATSPPNAQDRFTYSPPVITRISPTSGPDTGGTYVDIFGISFAPSMTVRFGSSAPVGVSCQGGTWCTTYSPPGTGVVDIVATVNGASSSSSPADQFTYEPFPSISGISPSSGPATGGTAVVITGTHFGVGSLATSIVFGTNPATSVNCQSTQTCTAISPPGSQTVDVAATTNGHTSITGPHSAFSYAPVVTGLNPANGPASGGTSVAISGAGFAMGLGRSSVDFGGTTIPYSSVNCTSPTTCSAVNPAGSGSVDVHVSVGGHTSANNSSDQFTYNAMIPKPGWTRWFPSPPPLGSALSLLTYDPGSNHLLLFGPPYIGGYAQTWISSGVGAWANVSPAATPPPGTGLAFDMQHQLAVLFGGKHYTQTGPSGPLPRPQTGNTPPSQVTYQLTFLDNNTWLYDGANWNLVQPKNSPTARYAESMTYDAARGQVLLFGGCNGKSCLGYLNDTWAWDGSTWAQMSPATSPSPRASGSIAYDKTSGNVVLFGGQGSNGLLSDTWVWDGRTWTQRQVATSPVPRAAAGLAADPGGSDLILFGGMSASHFVTDTWKWDGGTWTQLSPSMSPSTEPVSMIYDEKLKLIVFFGVDGSVWTWSD